MATQRFIFRTLMPVMIAVALFAVNCPTASAATLAVKLQGTYEITSAKLIQNGKAHTGNFTITGTVQIGATGLAGSTIIPSIVTDTGLVLKLTVVKASTTSYSASCTGTNPNAGPGAIKQIQAGSSVKATLTTTGLTVTFALKGVTPGSVKTTDTLTLVLKKKA